MDFLDPQKQKAHQRRIMVGYLLIGFTLLLATIILLYKAYGFDLDRKGRVIQNGLVFMSSQPPGADVYVNGQKKAQTNARLILPAGFYTVELKKFGYRNWKRAVTVEGGSVGRFDYPFLVPSKLTTSTVKQYSSVLAFASQSNDRKWLLTQGASADQFDLYDLSVDKVTPKTVAVPAGILMASSSTRSWAEIEWGSDNRHVILQRSYDKGGQQAIEYILFDRQEPDKSQNLSELWGFNPTAIEMNDKKYDQYYLYDQNARQILTSSIKKPTPQSYLKEVLSFKTDGSTVIYITATGAPEGKVLVKIQQANDSYTLRQLPANDEYLLQLAKYSGAWYVAAGAKGENKVYVYKDPVGSLKDSEQNVLVPINILKVAAPNYVSFSKNSRFVTAENKDSFAVYDAETDKAYAFQAKVSIDAPQTHAVWMDGYHLSFVSGGKLAIFDFDGANTQVLMAAGSLLPAFFTPNYQAVFVSNGQNALTDTSLVVKN